jgi:hypothetical protein
MPFGMYPNHKKKCFPKKSPRAESAGERNLKLAAAPLGRCQCDIRVTVGRLLLLLLRLLLLLLLLLLLRACSGGS